MHISTTQLLLVFDLSSRYLRINPSLFQSSASSVQLTMAMHSGAMKLQAVAAALCLVLLLGASETVLTASAAGCDVYKLAPCIAASKNANVAPSRQCCTNVASLGKGQAGANCLCSLLSSPLAKAQGVVPRIALAIPQKCRIAVPKGFVCQGIRVPGS